MARSALLALSLLGAAQAAGVAPAADVHLCSGPGEITVEALVLSGSKNPTVELGGLQRHIFCNLLGIATLRGTANLPTCRVLGFTGWRACLADGSRGQEQCAVLRGDWALDTFLLQALKGAHELPESVLSHIAEEAARLRRVGGDDESCAREHLVPIIGDNANCSSQPRGSDDPHQVHYDPPKDDLGCFVTAQYDNNCYDYGTDIATGTFAQPGRGSGVCPPHARPCVNNTCQDVIRAAESDGLKFVGTTLPTALPAKGHYVSLHIWPSTNFHWLRMDADMYWSHKPGGSEVRNVDNNQQKINDPSKADVSPWTQHCGYMLAVPSTIRPQLAKGVAQVFV